MFYRICQNFESSIGSYECRNQLSKARVQRWRQRFRVGMHRWGSRRWKEVAMAKEARVQTGSRLAWPELAWLGFGMIWAGSGLGWPDLAWIGSYWPGLPARLGRMRQLAVSLGCVHWSTARSSGRTPGGRPGSRKLVGSGGWPEKVWLVGEKREGKGRKERRKKDFSSWFKFLKFEFIWFSIFQKKLVFFLRVLSREFDF